MASSPAPASPSAALSASLEPSVAASPTAGGRLLGYAFNTGSQDVTLFDPVSRQRLETRPLGATVRWLSNEQRFWDGRYIWTFDYPNQRVQVIGSTRLRCASPARCRPAARGRRTA